MMMMIMMHEGRKVTKWRSNRGVVDKALDKIETKKEHQ